MRIARSIAVVLAAIALVAASVAAPAGDDPDKDPQMVKLLQEARQFVDSRKPAEAIPKCDAVIDAFRAYYGNSTQKVFCARTSAESLGVLLRAAVDKTKAIALSSTWSDAYFMKGYALQDLHRLGEAKSMLQRALELSPLNSQYLAEMGEVDALEKNWPKAEQAYREAEDNAPLSPEASLDDTVDADGEAQWQETIDRRSRDIAEGKVTCRPVEETVRDLRAKLHARRQPS